MFLWEWMSAVDGHVNHAGELETSMHPHTYPDEVGSPTDGNAATWDDTVDSGIVNRFMEKFSKSDTVGDATFVSAE